jgi:hypothetical protein
VVEHPGFFLRQNHDPPRAVGKSLEHVAPRPKRALDLFSALYPHANPGTHTPLVAVQNRYSSIVNDDDGMSIPVQPEA